ncbi:MAG TPA: pilin [Candidatus Bathyarchaeia archaeon]|nr:pilin [Candidatus Bathyarchaeia archaeon]
MKRIINTILINLSLVASLLFVALTPQAAGAIDVFQNCGGSGGGAVSGTASGSSICGATSKDDFSTIMHNIINTMLFVLGMIAVLMIVIGGIRYTTSNGDSAATKSAKDTILYSVIGLVVAIMAYAIVNFVVGRFGGN